MRALLPMTLVLSMACTDTRNTDPTEPTSPPTGDTAPTFVDGLYADERAARPDELPRPDTAPDTLSSIGHFQVHRQASTYYRGPTSNDAQVQLTYFSTDFATDNWVSPFQVISPRTYGVGTHTLWGAGLTHAYKVSLDDELAILDTWRINRLPTSLPWNLQALADGRILITDQDGFDVRDDNAACEGDDPTLIVLDDDPRDLTSAITCQQVFEFDEASVRTACGVKDGTYERQLSALALVPTFTGEIATRLVFANGGKNTTYLAVVDEGLTEIVDCALLDAGLSTNALSAEPLGSTTTAFYAVTETSMIKMTFDSTSRRVARSYERDVPVRFRTGTTPTLVDPTPDERLVVFVDARCAVHNPFNGLIVCNDDTGPSQLVAVRRDDDLGGREPVVTTALPTYIDTVENSPAARGDMVTLANYSGYLPNGLIVPAGGQPPAGGPSTPGASPDAVADFATGLVALQWSPAAGAFQVAWEVPDRQVNSITTISGGANLVYGFGAEQATERVYLYGFRLRGDASGPGGEELLRIEIAQAPFRTPSLDDEGNNVFTFADYRIDVGEFYDQGNSKVIHTDRSMILSGNSGIARVRDPQP
ncbi:MAG: hypothetical protein KTR31_42005 [Myxococcales bacterium]|nr:hypothetical protein [Myxococcales bacterium]